MKALVIAAFSLLGCFLVVNSGFRTIDDVEGAPAEGVQDRSEIEQKTANLYGKLPLSFVENKGQFDEQVRFQARSPRATVYFTPTEVVFHFVEKDDPFALTEQGRSDNGAFAVDTPTTRRELAVRVSFPGARDNPDIIGQDELEERTNVFRGNDPDKWLTDVPSYRGVVYRDLWKGIDLVYHSEEGYGLKYDLVVHPKADPALARMRYEGHKGLRVNSDGELIIETAFGPIVEKKPYIYQDIKGKRVEVSGSFVVQSDTVTWHIGKYDTSHSLIIDPGMVYSTFLGGEESDSGRGITVDAEGCGYVIGHTYSSDFPMTPGAYDTIFNGGYRDCFITKINASGDGLVYSTFLGGSDADGGCGIAVDTGGCVYVTGETHSSDFPTTPGAYDTTYNGGIYDGDAFVTKLNASGDALVYSTFLGGSDNDYGNGIAVDAEGCAYITGYTGYSGVYNFVFVTKLNTSGSNLLYSTFLGGSSADWGWDIAVDTEGCAYVTGITQSSDFPTTPGAYDRTYNGGLGDWDAFVTKVNASGSSLAYSTFLGGSNNDESGGIAVDSSGCAYVTGRTHQASCFPTTPGAYDTTHNGGDYDGFVTKLNNTGNNLVYSTLIGGSEWEYSKAIAVDATDCVYVTGYTSSSDFPTTPDAYDMTHNGGYNDGDVFVTKLNASGSGLIYSTFLGGSSSDVGSAIAVDTESCFYITGYTSSSGFPTTPGAYDTTYNDNCDSFVTKFGMGQVTLAITDVTRNAAGNIEITFTTTPVLTYRVEVSTSPYDYIEANMTWSDQATGIPGGISELIWEDTSTPGTSEKYYRVVRESDSSVSDTVGLMYINVQPGKNLVSSPFEPYPESGGTTTGLSTLDKIIGDQLTGHLYNPNLSDNIEIWDNAAGMYRRSWYNTSTSQWLSFFGGAPEFGLDADLGYWFNIKNTAKDVMLFGKVATAHRTIDIAKDRNLVGSAFPVTVALADSGLVASGFTGHIFNKNLSDNVEFWGNADGFYTRAWYNISAGAWLNATGGAVPDIDPGEGFWINVLDAHTAFTWTYPAP